MFTLTYGTLPLFAGIMKDKKRTNVETWKSDKGQEEIHHFVEGAQNTYLFGFNRKLLGRIAYESVRRIVEDRLIHLAKWGAEKT